MSNIPYDLDLEFFDPDPDDEFMGCLRNRVLKCVSAKSSEENPEGDIFGTVPGDTGIITEE